MDENADAMVEDLRQNKLPEALSDSDGSSDSNITSFDLAWLPEHGIDPELSEEHRNYLDQLCDVFEDFVMRKIEQSILNRFVLEAWFSLWAKATMCVCVCTKVFLSLVYSEDQAVKKKHIQAILVYLNIFKF